MNTVTRKKTLNDKICAELFKSLSDETRLKIIFSLFQGHKCVSELTNELGLAQSHVSHHLKILKVTGIVHSWREGHKICYELSQDVGDGFTIKEGQMLDLGCCEIRFK